MDMFVDYYLCARGHPPHGAAWPSRHIGTNTVLLFYLAAPDYTHSSILSTKWNLLITGRIPVEGQYKRVEITTPIAPSDISIAEVTYPCIHIFVQVMAPLGLEQRVIDVHLPAISVYNPWR